MRQSMKPLPACLSQKQRDNLWKKVARCGPADCWLWLSDDIGESGYPEIWVNNIAYVATRIAYLDFYGKQPGKLLVCHTCDNTLCMNPHHFFLGTHDDNMADRQAKERQCKGEHHYKAILTEDQVLEILSLEGKVSSTTLADSYSVSKSTIKAIWQGLNWSYLTKRKRRSCVSLA